MHPTNAMVQTNAAGALINISFIHRHGVEIATNGGFSILLSAMQSHPSDATLQSNCFGVLSNLSCAVKLPEDVAKVVAHAAEMAKANHPTDQSVQGYVDCTLSHIKEAANL
jgi:hypothetical protein